MSVWVGPDRGRPRGRCRDRRWCCAADERTAGGGAMTDFRSVSFPAAGHLRAAERGGAELAGPRVGERGLVLHLGRVPEPTDPDVPTRVHATRAHERCRGLRQARGRPRPLCRGPAEPGSGLSRRRPWLFLFRRLRQQAPHLHRSAPAPYGGLIVPAASTRSAARAPLRAGPAIPLRKSGTTGRMRPWRERVSTSFRSGRTNSAIHMVGGHHAPDP